MYDTQEIHTLFGETLSFDEMMRQLEISKNKLTPSQLIAFEAVRAKATKKEQFLFFVTRPGGTGKSFLLKTLNAMF